MNNILVLGAGSLQIPLIERVISRGYNPVVISLFENEPGMRIVKDTVIGDFCEEEFVLKVAKEYNVIGIVTDQTDLPVRSIAYVSDHLGLPSIGYKTACLFTDKFLMREKCKQIGIQTVPYILSHHISEAISFFCKLNKSVIIKPVNNQGSKGVYRVNNVTELEDKYKEAEKYSRGEPILIEQFITGKELVIEAVTVNGCTENLICGDTYYFNVADAFSAKQRIFPSNKNNRIVSNALNLNKRIIKGFGLNRGITHAEYIFEGDNIYLLEIAARGGGVYISSDIIPLMTGFNSTDFIINAAINEELEIPQLLKKDITVCYVAFFLKEGEITSIKGVDYVKNLHYVHHHNLDSLYIGKTIQKNIDKTSRYFMIIEAKSDEELNRRIEDIHSFLCIIVNHETKNNAIIWN